MADNSKTSKSKVDLGDAAYTSAALGSTFVPGAGVADVMGYAPDPFNPGQMSPSFSENLEEGRYIDAGLQTLGLAGDALYAVAPFTAGIAALPAAGLKTLQAGAKTLRGSPTEALTDLTTPELITSWVIEPSKVDRTEVASRLLSQPDVAVRSNQALDTMGYGVTVPMFRLVKLTDDGNLQTENLISATLNPNKVPSNIKFLTEGKFGMTTPTDYRLVRYDVPREKIAGYLPAVADDIKRTVNRAVKEKGFGQDSVPGMTTVTNPAEYAKGLIKLQDEIIADVSGLKPTVLVDGSGKPMNMLSMSGTLPKLVAEGRVTTPEDISEILPNDSVINPMEYAKQNNDIPYEEAERQARAALIRRYQDFFSVQNKAEGGVITLADTARNMNRGPRGVASLAPIARNMNRPMVS